MTDDQLERLILKPDLTTDNVRVILHELFKRIRMKIRITEETR